MATAVLHVTGFGGGVVREGSSDSQRTDELVACDGYDIGPRGQLVTASDLSAGVSLTAAVGVPINPIYGCHILETPQEPLLLAVGDANVGVGTQPYLVSIGLSLTGAIGATPLAALIAKPEGVYATFCSFPYVNSTGVQLRVALINWGPRFFVDPQGAGGLWVLIYDPLGTHRPSYSFQPISDFDALGTGAFGEFLGGTGGYQLIPRFIEAYNNHVFLFGYDAHAAPAGDGPTRVMFSNIGNPLKYGFDPDAEGIADGTIAEHNRSFVDSDAFTLGDAGEMLRGAKTWRGRLWVGSNRQLHYIEGYGRESFLTNGAIPIARSRNVVGPHALIEGPDGLLYGVSDDVGLWVCDGGAVDPIGAKLRDFKWKSNGYWDLIWSDVTAGALLTYPGRSNQDLVWMMSDPQHMQVWVGIPWCNATLGYGVGTDTVIVKYHTLTGGFTRQVFAGKILTHGEMVRQGQDGTPRTRVATVSGGAPNLQRYAVQATPATSPMIPAVLPDVTFGEYAPFGPDGVGVMHRRYLTIAWESGTLPLKLRLTATVDGQAMPTVTLTIGAVQPVAPANGDRWVDTSGTSTDLGNGTAGSSFAGTPIFPANAADYVFWTYVAGWAGWRRAPGGGQQGTRVTVPIPFDHRRGARVTVRAETLAASGRWQIEGFAEAPEPVTSRA